MFKFFKNVRRNEEGATAIEYGLIAALVAIGLIGALTQLSGGLDTIFGNVTTALQDPGAQGGDAGGAPADPNAPVDPNG